MRGRPILTTWGPQTTKVAKCWVWGRVCRSVLGLPRQHRELGSLQQQNLFSHSLEATSPQSRWTGLRYPEGSRGESVPAPGSLGVGGNPRLVDLSLHPLPPWSWGYLPCVCLFPSSGTDPRHTGLRCTPLWKDLNLRLSYICTDPISNNAQVPGVQTLSSLEDTVPPTNKGACV